MGTGCAWASCCGGCRGIFEQLGHYCLQDLELPDLELELGLQDLKLDFGLQDLELNLQDLASMN